MPVEENKAQNNKRIFFAFEFDISEYAAAIFSSSAYDVIVVILSISLSDTHVICEHTHEH